MVGRQKFGEVADSLQGISVTMSPELINNTTITAKNIAETIQIIQLGGKPERLISVKGVQQYAKENGALYLQSKMGARSPLVTIRLPEGQMLDDGQLAILMDAVAEQPSRAVQPQPKRP